MGYILRRAVMDALPEGFSFAERAVISELADWARDDTRLAHGADLLETVRRRAGLASVKQVRNILTKLAKKGLELRVTVYTVDGPDGGRDMVAWRGHQTTYRIPPLDVIATSGVARIAPTIEVAEREVL